MTWSFGICDHGQQFSPFLCVFKPPSSHTWKQPGCHSAQSFVVRHRRWVGWVNCLVEILAPRGRDHCKSVLLLNLAASPGLIFYLLWQSKQKLSCWRPGWWKPGRCNSGLISARIVCSVLTTRWSPPWGPWEITSHWVTKRQAETWAVGRRQRQLLWRKHLFPLKKKDVWKENKQCWKRSQAHTFCYHSLQMGLKIRPATWSILLPGTKLTMENALFSHTIMGEGGGL